MLESHLNHGQKTFQRPINEGVVLINAVQEIYLANQITIA